MILFLEDSVGFSRKRVGVSGRARYAAVYRDLKGRQRSAGTYTTRREADRAWQRAEVMLRAGRVGDPARGRQTFQQYVEGTWFSHHQAGGEGRVQRFEVLLGAACSLIPGRVW
jgi:hypothetical protein